eukprot:PLAT5672.1.p1 GENE.PLAT5672.1~~PLAT5672.1.p1  ORF type:complete len:359 (+),score=188.35 PLAT5672.1:43-1077(+)
MSSPGVSLDSTEAPTFAVVLIVTILVLIIAIILVRASVKIVYHAEVMIVEKFGRYTTTLKPGLHFLWPMVEVPRTIDWRYLTAAHNNSSTKVVSVKTDRVDMREHLIDFGRQHVITRDTVQIEMDALVYFRITDPRLAVYNIQNLPDAIELLTKSTLRNIVAKMTLDDTFSSREDINGELLGKVAVDAERWGVTITRVEIFNIDPPGDIKKAMEKQIQAERERRSLVLEADGIRESSVIKSRGTAARMVLQAEGQRTADLQRAKGDAEAKLLSATSEAQSINFLREAIGDATRAVDYLLAVQYLNSLRSMTMSTSPSKVVLVPADTVDSISELMTKRGRAAGGL